MSHRWSSLIAVLLLTAPFFHGACCCMASDCVEDAGQALHQTMDQEAMPACHGPAREAQTPTDQPLLKAACSCGNHLQTGAEQPVLQASKDAGSSVPIMIAVTTAFLWQPAVRRADPGTPPARTFLVAARWAPRLSVLARFLI